MRRIVWAAVGAAGGIYAYRRGQQALGQARSRGVVGNVAAATNTTASLAAQARSLMALAQPILAAAAAGAATQAGAPPQGPAHHPGGPGAGERSGDDPTATASGPGARAAGPRSSPGAETTPSAGAAAARVLADAARAAAKAATVKALDPTPRPRRDHT